MVWSTESKSRQYLIRFRVLVRGVCLQRRSKGERSENILNFRTWRGLWSAEERRGWGRCPGRSLCKDVPSPEMERESSQNLFFSGKCVLFVCEKVTVTLVGRQRPLFPLKNGTVPKGGFYSDDLEEPFWVPQRAFQMNSSENNFFLSVKNILII